VILVAALGLALAGCTATASTSTGQPDLVVTRGGCGGTWHAAAGDHTFQIQNAGTVTADVDLVDPKTDGVYAEVESLAPTTTRPMHVLLGKGDYAFRCFGEDTDAATGPTVRIASGVGSPEIVPVTRNEMAGAVTAYRASVSAGLAALVTDASALDARLHAGDLAGSRAAWLAAHLRYERLGAAYDTFGDFADAVDGTPDGLPGGVADKDFTGFHRIEYGLWHGAAPASLVGVGDQLVAEVTGLRDAFPKQETDPLDLPLRAHEIMENALQFELTGATDEGSGTNLATIDANLDGTQMVLDAIAPVIRPRYVRYPAIADWIARTRSIVEHGRNADGSWIPVAAFQERERLDGDVGQLLETLAPVAAIGEMRRTD
jgi:iron uptake system EfeUOB component EfeO/EfeM